MPRIRQRCVRPRSASEVSSGISRAIRHAILLVPTSSTDRIALLRAERGLRRGGIMMRSRLSGFGFRGLAAEPERIGALGERLFGEPGDDAIRQAQIERDHVFIENACLTIE